MIEGIPTMILAVIIFFALPSTPEQSKCEGTIESSAKAILTSIQSSRVMSAT